MTSHGVSRTKLLEENISILESRIQELESPDTVSRSVKLHALPASGSQTGRIELTMPSAHDVPASASANDSRVNLTSDEIYSLWAHSLTISLVHYVTVFHSTDAFLLHASRIGFFLNVGKFVGYVRGPLGASGQRPLLDVLISVICLWGSRFSSNVAIQARQDQLLGNAVRQVTDALSLVNSEVPTHDVISFIQAEVLLSNYFFTYGRLLEGRYYSSAAITLALSYKLNMKPRDAGSPASPTLLSALPPPEDPIEVGERVNAFWTAHALYKAWAVALESPSAVWAGEGSFGAQVEISWPLSMDACEKVCRHDLL